MRPRRLVLAGLVLLGLAPGTLLRSTPPAPDLASPVRVSALPVGAQPVGDLTLEGAWVLASGNDLFGGWSALVDLGDGRLLAASDAGRVMEFRRPDLGPAAPQLSVLPGLERLDKRDRDLESLTRDPRSGTLWAGFERSNALARIDAGLVERARTRPPQMARWPDNAGPETLVRLADGRFIVVAETAVAPAHHEALLFPGDPTRGAPPQAFRLKGRVDYRPADAALLPDGRVLILLRRIEWRWPLRFPALLVLADPREIEAGGVLATHELARIEDPLPSDNFEGLAITGEEQDRLAIWLISDDNFSRLQRTILLKLEWREKEPAARQKARE